MHTPLNHAPRFYVYIFLFLGLLGNFSCEESSLLEDVEIVSDENTASGSSTSPKSNNQEAFILETRLQWASYITARIFCQDDNAREEVATFLASQNTNVVSIDELIVSEEHTPIFRSLFIDEADFFLINQYLDSNGEPSHNQLIPPSSRQANLSRSEQYIDFLTVDNCVELFFPNGLSSIRADSYYSTAHPLTLAESNDGYEVLCVNRDTNNIWGSVNAIIDAPLVNEGHQVILARPYRVGRLSGCSYKMYNDLDFTQFLNL